VPSAASIYILPTLVTPHVRKPFCRVLGPQGIFAKIPGLGEAFKLLTQVLPLGRGAVVERNGKIYVA
jgi:hypothetical protein